MILTFDDLLDHCLAFGGDDATGAQTNKARAAVLAAYKVVATQHEWSYLWALGRISTQPSFSAGTIAYTAATGTVVLTGSTWPSWVASGYLVFNNVTYNVAQLVDAVTVKVDPSQVTPDDVAAGTSYQLLRDRYPLPADFLGVDEVIINSVGAVLSYEHPRNWSSQRRTNTGPGQPWMFSLIGSNQPASVGQMRMVFWPPPDVAYAVDFLYRRRGRDLVYSGVSDGTVSVSVTGTTVTGRGTNFRAGMVGSVLRLAADNRDPPTGPGGLRPFDWETRITAVASATSLTVADAAPVAYAGVAYAISDPVDIEPETMMEYTLREVERQFRMVARSQPTDDEVGNYQLALTRALENDNRATGRLAALRKQTRRSGFIHYPIQFTGG